MNPLDPLRTISPLEWPPSAAERVLSALRHDDPVVRLEAAQLAWHAMNNEVAGALLELLQDQPAIAATAAQTLGAVLEEHDAPSQDEAWARVGPYTTTSRAMFQAIVEALEAAWGDRSLLEPVRMGVLEAASHAPRPWVDREVRLALKRPESHWRALALFCAGMLPGLELDILEALEDPDPMVRAEALRAAGRQSLPEAEPTLQALARDPKTEASLRLVAVEALGRMPPGDATTDALLDSLVDEETELGVLASLAREQRAMQSALNRWDTLDF